MENPKVIVWNSDMGAAFRVEGGKKDGYRSQNRFDSKAAARRAAKLYLNGTSLADIDSTGNHHN